MNNNIDFSNIQLSELQELYKQFNDHLENLDPADMRSEKKIEESELYLNENKGVLKNLIKGHIVNKDNLNLEKIDKSPNLYLTAIEAETMYQRIINSHSRINFRGQFSCDILKNGYKHWSLLESTQNTENMSLFIERLASEFFIFDIKLYNSNILRRANNLFTQDKERFIKEWNERFKTSFSQEDMEQIFIQTGFIRTEKKYGVIFSCLYDDKGLIHTAEKVGQAYIEKTYGKSQIILKKEYLANNTTFCLGDTFDAEPSGNEWKTTFASKLDKQFVLFDLSSKENVYYRLRSLSKDSIPYIENHLFFQIQTKHIEKLIISQTELDDYFGDASESQKEIKKLEETYGIPIEII